MRGFDVVWKMIWGCFLVFVFVFVQYSNLHTTPKMITKTHHDANAPKVNPDKHIKTPHHANPHRTVTQTIKTPNNHKIALKQRKPSTIQHQQRKWHRNNSKPLCDKRMCKQTTKINDTPKHTHDAKHVFRLFLFSKRHVLWPATVWSYLVPGQNSWTK